jgi:hypothetical protein
MALNIYGILLTFVILNIFHIVVTFNVRNLSPCMVAALGETHVYAAYKIFLLLHPVF